MKTTLRFVFISTALIVTPLVYAGGYPKTSEEPSATTNSVLDTTDSGLKGSQGNTGEMGVSGKRSWPGHAGAMKAAKQSPEALRQYIERTKSVYGLSIADFVQEN